MTQLNNYVDEARLEREVEAGRHRDVIGGLWDELGALQLDFLKAQGLEPQHTLLDLGCGAGRLAVKAVPLLDQGNYYGIDASPSLLDAARRELDAAGCIDRVGRGALHATADFRPGPHMPALFDYVIAQSLFTHLPAEHLMFCLDVVAPRLRSGRRFYATFFEGGWTPKLHELGGVTTYPDRDPYHIGWGMLQDVAHAANCTATYIGEWGHPRDQMMCEFIRA